MKPASPTVNSFLRYHIRPCRNKRQNCLLALQILCFSVLFRMCSPFKLFFLGILCFLFPGPERPSLFTLQKMSLGYKWEYRPGSMLFDVVGILFDEPWGSCPHSRSSQPLWKKLVTLSLFCPLAEKNSQSCLAASLSEVCLLGWPLSDNWELWFGTA